MTRGPHRAAVAVAVLALLAASCGQGASAIPAEAGIAELAAAYAPCPEPVDAVAPAFEHLEQAFRWIQVQQIINRGDDLNSTLPATVLVQDTIDANVGTKENVSIHGSYWPGVEWAFDTGGQVWFALGDPKDYTPNNMVIYVLVFTADGRAFFPGSCQQEILYQPLERALGDAFDATMKALPEKTGDELVTALRGAAPEEPPDVPILNPETVSEELLNSLKFAVLHVTVSAELGPEYTICTRVKAGWNDCFVPDAEAVKVGYTVDAFLDDSGVLEIWLLDADANLLEPIELLGKVTIPASLTNEDEIALRLEIDTAPLSRGGPAAAVLVEAIPLAELDINDPDWPGLSPVTTDDPSDSP